jgi:hypothetical protein
VLDKRRLVSPSKRKETCSQHTCFRAGAGEVAMCIDPGGDIILCRIGLEAEEQCSARVVACELNNQSVFSGIAAAPRKQTAKLISDARVMPPRRRPRGF